jgi:hypothetical protein
MTLDVTGHGPQEPQGCPEECRGELRDTACAGCDYYDEEGEPIDESPQ